MEDVPFEELPFETFKKLPLGGVDRRALVSLLADKGPSAARDLLTKNLARVKRQGASLAEDTAVLILGGSNGITRAVAIQLAFGEGAHVFCVHYDSAKMQIGEFHAAAISAEAAKQGRTVRFFNRDATREQTIEEVVAELKGHYRAVHFINGVAAGATKRYAKYGPTKVRDIDVAFDPVLQVPAFDKKEAYRKFGLVEVEVATETEIERTNKFMGTSSLLWVEPLAAAGLIAKGESTVAFCDYAYEPEDPVYAMGPLAGAKVLQRETMAQIRERFGARTVRLCYPAMPTTALGAIPGGTVMFALTGQILMERGEYQSIDDLARETMRLWKEPLPQSELRLDDAYQRCLPEFHKRKVAFTPEHLPQAFELLYTRGV